MTELIGQTLGPYRIVEQIGMGGMATVYKAYQASMDRYVAVKVLPRQFAEDPSFLGRFEQEARTIAKLEHPHILPVHDYGQQEATTYLVMRFIGAGTLKELMVERGPLDLDEALRIMEQVGSALGYAHSQGVIHRDIKPSNVLVDPRDDCFLTDFGIARLVEGTTEFTATGRIVGTPAYMAPEQGMGEKADERSDIYALGIILYQMATGKVPYEAETPLAVLMKHATAPLPLPRQIRPELPESVERVILKALSKSSVDRFQRAEDMVAALRQAVTSPEAPVTEATAPLVLEDTTAIVDQAPPVTEAVPGRTPPRSFPFLPVLAGGGAILIALAIAGLLILPGLISGPEVEATAPPAEDETGSQPLEVEASPTSAEASASQTEALAEADPTPEPAVAPTTLEPGWTVFLSGDDVRTLAVQNEYIWAAGSAGLVRWNRSDGSYQWFSIADGLASNDVKDLLVGPDGILWAGTYDGLSRYDPEADRWTTYDTSDGLEGDQISSLYYDEADGVLVAGIEDYGFNVYDGTQWQAPGIPPMPFESPEPRAILGAEGNLVVGTDEDGVAYFDGDEWQVSVIDPEHPDAGVQDLYVTREGELLAATWEGVYQFDSEAETWALVPQLDFAAYAILEDSSGLLWFAGEGGVYRFDPTLGDWESYESQSQELPAWVVTSVVEDQDGVLWFGSAGGGLSRLEDDRWEVWAIGQGPAGSDIEALAEDKDGNIWMAMDDGRGLSRYSPATGHWRSFAKKDGALDWPTRPFVDGEGRVWIGSWASARFFDGEMWRKFENDAFGRSSVVTIAQDESGAMWFGQEEATIVRLERDGGSAQVFTASDGLPEGEVSQLLPTGYGLTMATVSGKLMVFDGTQWRHELSDQDPIGRITTAPSGQVWVAGGEELFVYDGQAWDSISVPELWVDELSVGPDGVVWAGSWDGLGRYDPEENAWEFLEPGEGQIPSAVADVLVARDGTLWIATYGGLGRYVPPR
jgi:ligand-binding sensor domain-containing protein